MRRRLAVAAATFLATTLAAAPALACGGLIGPNGAVNLLRTTTLAGYHDGVEHYVTAFSFAGGGGKFGSIVPLPGVPTKIERGGDWTLQRLIRETTPITEGVALAAAADSATTKRSAQVLIEAKVDALNLTVLKGSGAEVGVWAKDNGFRLPPDAPEVLDFYGRRTPIFLAAAFDASRARTRGQRVGDGTPIHLTIPTDNPWVPLRILGLGKPGAESVQADVFLLTDRRPALLPAPLSPERAAELSTDTTRPGLVLDYDQGATATLLRDLHVDKSGGWVPLDAMWLSKVRVDALARDLTYDLAIDASGRGEPSRLAAGLPLPLAPGPDGANGPAATTVVLIAAAAAVTIALLAGIGRRDVAAR
ncbi:MAG: DUF2330 domain-containing protein [Frankia sp.]|nr:DUF2330 domain-containing protein [Frankia sp.]